MTLTQADHREKKEQSFHRVTQKMKCTTEKLYSVLQLNSEQVVVFFI